MSARALRVEAPGKVNLFLRILAREASGYHGLETLYAAVALADELHLTLGGEGVDLEVVSERGLGPLGQNLVHRAAETLLEELGETRGVRIRLRKEIPPGAGLGGGSSDAAATLKGLNHLLGSPLGRDDLVRLAGALGADVPFFLSPMPLALAWSRGDRLLPMEPLPQRPVLLALPPFEVDTASAYRALARERMEGGEPVPASGIMDPALLGVWERLAEVATNDFEALACREHPILAGLRDAFEDTRPLLTLLAGSGSGMFAVYSGEGLASDARDAVAEEFPEIRFVLTRTLRSFPGFRPEGGPRGSGEAPAGLEGPGGPT